MKISTSIFVWDKFIFNNSIKKKKYFVNGFEMLLILFINLIFGQLLRWPTFIPYFGGSFKDFISVKCLHKMESDHLNLLNLILLIQNQANWQLLRPEELITITKPRDSSGIRWSQEWVPDSLRWEVGGWRAENARRLWDCLLWWWNLIWGNILSLSSCGCQLLVQNFW